MAKVSVTACDVCGLVSDTVTSYTVEGGGSLARIDLCAEHAEPLKVIMERHPIAPNRSGGIVGRGAARRTQGFVRYVASSMDDVKREMGKDEG